MDVLILLIVCSAGYVIAYNTYGKFLANKIFRLDYNKQTPSVTLEDGTDFVPTKKAIIFGHHFTSIAGTGPIVGPAIGVIWGWLPAVLWVFLGSIFMGAVHDFGSLIISMRNEGKSLSEIAARYINPRVRMIFFLIVFVTLLLVISVFGVVIAAVFTQFPNSVIPVWAQIPISIWLGRMVYKRGFSVPLATIIAVILMYVSITIGGFVPVTMPAIAGIPASGIWTILLLIYVFIASALPVTVLLQPRDYINAWQLFIAMGMLMLGVIASTIFGGLNIAAPAVNQNLPAGTPPIWPFMFVIIACGAISGFHSLVASGTSPKQISMKKDALFVGYGSMLLEGLLGLLVIVCAVAGIAMGFETESGLLTGTDAWNNYYGTYLGASGLSGKLAPVVNGAANMMNSFGLPHTLGVTLMGVFIASFAGTTLDTSVRLQRYIITELAGDFKIKPLTNIWVATSFAVITAALLSFSNGTGGTGAMTLWPLFGSANQLLASFALLLITIYLKKRTRLGWLCTAIPCLIMLTITNWAQVDNFRKFNSDNKIFLAGISASLLILTAWVFIESLVVFFKTKNTESAAAKSAGA
ncbi:Inner membrane protein YjiY [Limihaloglobus sulfuriphilus]|uniref:Inner membrane protein YjiY n=1 Tax=Limihaloglobus sulfuriphilus TaxID=1851148 RepID=A0A1Q2MCB3_9BACT|nr:carbon starvation protein A [Limihaloglobus sulfuriphilus]AQQ70353.1 Inner membrane protein YjiY [Limihaloglobus sulfuriphilus]